MLSARPVPGETMPKTLIVTPLRKEFDALAGYLASEGCESEALEVRTASAWFEGLGLLLAVAGHGKAQFAAVTQHLIERCGPFDLVIAAGASGALDAGLSPGDVVVATGVVEHDYKLRFDGDEPAPRHACSAEARESIAAAASVGGGFKLRTGAIASGDEDVVHQARAAELREGTGALCVAWEGAGGARAAAFSGVPFLEIRAITDAADDEAPESYRVNLPDAVANIGRLLLPWLRKRSGAQHS
jgi:nucleoside phosphorylase